jgi:hypothetical protein
MLRPRIVVVLVLVLGAVLAACSVDDLDLGSKECPCISSYVCDVPTNRCVLSLASDAAVIPDVADVGSDDAAAPPPLVVVSALTATWTTPGSIRWDWKLAGSAADFRTYEIVTGPSVDAIDKRVGVDVLTSNERPELGAFDARGGRTQGPVDMWTLTDVRNPAIKQFVQVKVTDVKGRASRTAIVSATSAARAAKQLVIFDGTTQKTAAPAGVFVFRSPAGGESHYFFATDCAGPKTCAKGAELVSLGLDLAPAGAPFTAAEFDVSILEIQLEGNAATTSFDTTVAIEPGSGACAQGDGLCRYRFTGWTQRATGRTKIQVPLRELRNDAGKLTFPILQGKNFLVDAFVLSGTWKNGSAVQLYDARIRW